MIRWLALYILLGILIWRQESHALRFDQRAEGLNGNIYRLMETSDHVLHNVSPKHPHNSWELKSRPPVLGCKCCSDLAAEQGSGL